MTSAATVHFIPLDFEHVQAIAPLSSILARPRKKVLCRTLAKP